MIHSSSWHTDTASSFENSLLLVFFVKVFADSSFFFLHFGFYLRMSTNDLYRICRIWKQRLYTKTIFNPAAENNARYCPRVSGASPVTICIHTEIVQIFKDCVFPSPVRATCAWTNVRTVSDLWRHEPLSASGHNITAFERLRRQAYNKIYSNN